MLSSSNFLITVLKALNRLLKFYYVNLSNHDIHYALGFQIFLDNGTHYYKYNLRLYETWRCSGLVLGL